MLGTMKWIAAAAAALIASGAHAADAPYPARPVKIEVGANAGGGTDIIARMLAEKFQASTGQPFVVENKPGASNTIAADFTAKAPPDGYTLLVATNTGQAIAPHMLKLGFDPLTQLQAVGLIVVVPNVLVVGATTPYQSVKDLVAAAKAKPGRCQVRIVGYREHAAHRGRGVRPRCRHQDDAHPLQGQQPGARRRAVGRSADDVRHDVVGDGTDQGRKVPAARRHVADALGRAAERADDCGSGLPAAEMTTWYGLFVTGGTPKPVVDKLAAELDEGACAARRAGKAEGHGRRARQPLQPSSSPS